MKLQGVTSVAAGARVNVLAGQMIEKVKRPSKIRIYLVGDAGGNFRCTVQSGSETLMDESPISRAARVPVVPDDLTVEDIAMPGDYLAIWARNVSAGALDIFWAVESIELR